MANTSNSSNLPFDIIFIKEHPNDIIEFFIKDKSNRIPPKRAFYKKMTQILLLNYLRG